MLAATVAAFGIAYLVASRLGADSATLRSSMIALAVGTFATFVPVAISFARETWGVAVLLAGLARAMVMLGYCFLLKETEASILTRPLFVSAAAASMFLLVIEVVTSIRILSALDRGRPIAPSTRSDTPTGKPA